MVPESPHLAAVSLPEPELAAAHAQALPVHLLLPEKHATLLVRGDKGVLKSHVTSMQALKQGRDVEGHSLAARTRAHRPLAGACEAVPLVAVHHGHTHRGLPRARDGRLSTMQVMRRWRQKVTRTVIPAHPCIFCGEHEEDTGHMRIMCARDETVPRLLCPKVKEFTANLPLTDKAMEFMSWNEHGYRWTESLMTGVVPADLKRLFVAVRAACSMDPAKAKLFLEEIIQIGEDVYA